MSFRTALCGLAAITLFAVSPAIASAQTITFTHTGEFGSGTINGAGFVRKAITFSATASVLDRESFASGFFIRHALASITIADVGTYTFVTATRTYVNNAVNQVGFSRAGDQQSDLFNGPRDAFADWDMLSSIGPIAGNMFLTQWSLFPVATSGGTLVFDESQTAGTFSAVVSNNVVPEPTTFALVGVAIVLLGAGRRVRALQRR